MKPDVKEFSPMCSLATCCKPLVLTHLLPAACYAALYICTVRCTVQYWWSVTCGAGLSVCTCLGLLNLLVSINLSVGHTSLNLIGNTFLLCFSFTLVFPVNRSCLNTAPEIEVKDFLMMEDQTRLVISKNFPWLQHCSPRAKCRV